MAKLKKHQLLEKAMRDYPAGTVARFKSAPTVDHISNGVFSFCDFNKDGKLHIVCGSGINCVYSDGEWAVPVNHSTLTDKCAIQVNNEREFKLLMEHYVGKGWRWCGGENPLQKIFIPESYPDFVRYEDKFTHTRTVGFDEGEDYTIIPFGKFAAEVGIEVPVFVMTSEDGVPLYVGDKIFEVVKYGDRWSFSNACCSAYIRMGAMCNTEGIKAFSSKETAEAFIAEQNKPKEVTVQLFNQFHSAKISKDWIAIRVGKEDSNTTTLFKPSDLEDMLHALKTLQP